MGYFCRVCDEVRRLPNEVSAKGSKALQTCWYSNTGKYRAYGEAELCPASTTEQNLFGGLRRPSKAELRRYPTIQPNRSATSLHHRGKCRFLNCFLSISQLHGRPIVGSVPTPICNTLAIPNRKCLSFLRVVNHCGCDLH